MHALNTTPADLLCSVFQGRPGPMGPPGIEGAPGAPVSINRV